MGYSAEVMKRARDRLAQAKADREAENRQRLLAAYEKEPRIREIDVKLRQTLAQAAQAVFVQGGDVAAAMEQVKKQNLSLQEERKQLVERHFPAGYLDDAPVCECCGGSGYIGSTMCECLKELCRQEQKKELSFLNAGQESFDQFRLDYYPEKVDPDLGVSARTVMEKTFKTCRNYAVNFTENAPNLLFSGGTGLGKTFLSACIAREVANNGYSVVYESAGHLFSNLERARFGGDEEQRQNAQRYTQCDLLIVDDLGTEMGGQFTTAALYSLVNDRLLAGRPTIISTNLNTEELARRYSAQIASRLRGEYVRLAFVGEDIRVIKNRRV